MIGFSIDWHLLSQQWLITVIHFLWQATVIGVVLNVILRLSAGTSARLRYAFSCASLFVLPVCVATTFAWVSSNSDQSIWLRADSPKVASTEQALATSDIVSASIGLNASPLPTESQMPLAAPDSFSVETTGPAAERQLKPSLATQWQTFLSVWSPWLMTAYCLGVLLVLGRLSIAIWGSQRLRTVIQPITDPALIGCFNETGKTSRPAARSPR